MEVDWFRVTNSDNLYSKDFWDWKSQSFKDLENQDFEIKKCEISRFKKSKFGFQVEIYRC